MTLALDLGFGREVTLLVSAHTVQAQVEWRQLRDPRDDVAEIYGKPVPGDPVRVVLWRGDADPRVVRPAEASDRTLLVSTGVDVLSAARLHLIGGALSLAAALLMLGLRVRRRSV